MKLITKILIGTAIFAFFGGTLFYFAQDLQDASLESFVITGLSEISTESFTFTGQLAIQNPSHIPVPVRNIEYELILEDTNNTITQGTLAPFILSPNTVSTTDIEQEVRWQPTTQLVTRLLLQDEVYATVTGRAYLNLPFLTETAIPFQDRVDIKDVLRQQEGVGDVIRTADNTRNTIENTSGFTESIQGIVG